MNKKTLTKIAKAAATNKKVEQPTHLTIGTFAKLSALAATYGLPKRDAATMLLSHAVRELPTTLQKKILERGKVKTR